VTALREQVKAFEDEARKAKRAVTELSQDRGEHASALEKMRVISKSREDELVDQLEALALKHTSEVGRLKNDLAGAEQQLSDQMQLLDQQRSSTMDTSTRLEEHEVRRIRMMETEKKKMTVK
jgi:hypothetical protein